MPKPDDGGPAFPNQIEACGGYPPTSFTDVMCGGMSLRDWFAGRALTGILAFSTGEDCIQYEPKDAAAAAYRFADAMLHARKG